MKLQIASSRAGALVLLGALAWPGLASATNGYFSHGYGVRAQGVAGVSIALPQDGLAAAWRRIWPGAWRCMATAA